jgi:hypothetical protein
MSVTLTNAEKQARYCERHLGADGEKVRIGFNLNARTSAKMDRLARHNGYTITALSQSRMTKTALQARRAASATSNSTCFLDGRDRAYRTSAQTPWQVPTCAAANPARVIVALVVIRRSSSENASSRSIGGGFSLPPPDSPGGRCPLLTGCVMRLRQRPGLVSSCEHATLTLHQRLEPR